MDRRQRPKSGRSNRGRVTQARGKPPSAAPSRRAHAQGKPSDASRLLHELQVHQAELGAQGEELRRTRRQLEAAAAEYTDLYDSCPIGCVCLDGRGGIREINLAAAKLLGRERSRLLGSPFASCVHGPDRRSFRRYIGIHRRRRLAPPCEIRLAAERGEPRPVEIRGMAERGARRGAERFRITLTDIRDRKRMEEALRVSLAKHQAIVDSFPLGITIADRSGKIVEINEEGRRLLGLSRDQHLRKRLDGRSWRALRADGSPMPKSEFASVRAWKENRIASNAGVGIFKANGKVTWIDVTAAPIPMKGGGVAVAYWDVGERLRMEAALREGRRRYEEAESIAHFGHWARDFVHNAAVWSEGMYRIVGREPGKFIPTWQGFLAIVHPDDREMVRSRVTAAIRDRNALDIEYRIVRPDGTVRTVQTLALPSSSGRGRASGLIGTLHDITEREQAEEALRQSEVRYRSLFENMIEGLAHCRMIYRGGKPADFVYLDVNRAFESITGLRNVIGRRVTEVIPGIRKSNPEMFEVYGRVASTGRPERFEGRVESLGVWFDVSVFSPQQGHFVAVFDDVTERKRAEEALRHSEAVLAEAQRIANVGSWEWNVRSGVLTWSDQLCRMFGEPRGSFVPTRAWFLSHVHPEDRKRVTKILQDAFAGRKPYMTEFRIVTDAGKTLVLQAQGEVAFDKSGRAVRVVGTALDITERHRLQAQLLQAQKMEAVGRLAGGVAHDFRNQLTVIKGFGEMLRRRSLVKEEGREKLEEILKAADRSALLSGQLLAFSRKDALQPQVVDVVELVADIGKAIPRLIGEDVRLRIIPSPRKCLVKIDPGQFQQAIFNLAANARDAMPGGGQLTIETGLDEADDRRPLRRPDGGRGPCAVVTVADTGCGMDEKTRSKLFEPFFTTKPVGKGTGLGLSLVYGFVSQSGGTIDVESSPGKGTSLRLYLPLARRPVAAGAGRPRTGAASRSPRGEC